MEQRFDQADQFVAVARLLGDQRQHQQAQVAVAQWTGAAATTARVVEFATRSTTAAGAAEEGEAPAAAARTGVVIEVLAAAVASGVVAMTGRSTVRRVAIMPAVMFGCAMFGCVVDEEGVEALAAVGVAGVDVMAMGRMATVAGTVVAASAGMKRIHEFRYIVSGVETIYLN
jgi:hypothetical protein